MKSNLYKQAVTLTHLDNTAYSFQFGPPLNTTPTTFVIVTMFTTFGMLAALLVGIVAATPAAGNGSAFCKKFNNVVTEASAQRSVAAI